MSDIQQEKLKTGTTTVGLVCKDCAILASESKSTLGWLVAGKTSKKVYQIDDKIAVTTAGGAGDTQALIRVLKAEISLYKMSRNADFSVKGVTTLISNILSGNRYFPYMAMLIIGGFDEEGAHIFSVDPVGGAEKDNYTATGSGSPIAFGVLEDGYREGLTKEEGIKLAVRSIRSARERDVFSGGKDVVVVVIDKNGLEFVDKEKIDEILK